MTNMKISRKIALLTSSVMVVGIGLSIYLLLNLERTRDSYNDVQNTVMKARTGTRDLEIDFRTQVQAWQDILLRGHVQADLDKYKAEWTAMAPKIKADAAEVKEASPSAEVDAVIDGFVTQYDTLMKEEREALAVYEKTEEAAAPTADALVRGKDVAVVDKLDEAEALLVKLADQHESAAAAAADAAIHRSIILMIVCYLGLGFIAWRLARSIVHPLNQLAEAVTHISDADAGDIQFRTGDDEIGKLGAAYQELIGYITEIGDATAQLAAGDFTAKVKPRSADDVLAKRFTTVTTTLTSALGEIGKLVNAAREGRLDQRASSTAFEGTYRSVIDSANGLMDAVRGPIDEAVKVMERMAQRDLREQMHGTYAGDFERLKTAINTAVADVSSSIGRVSSASEQLALGSSEIQRGSASLAQNTTEMASAVQAISERTGQLSTAAEQAANRARESEKAASSVADLATAGVRRMDQLSSAMTKIKESSVATGRIMQAINEIAFQTNLLALNAAVEAARAGDSGKGFAVVAEEVRSLALRSAESASNTGKLIEESIRAADEGVQVNTEATQSLHQLAKEIHRVAGEISHVATIVDDQKVGLVEIKQSVVEISVATQNTAALAEESASTADVLNSHGQKLRQLVDAFELDRREVGSARESKHDDGHNGHNGHNGHAKTNGHKNGRTATALLSAF